MQIAHEQTEDKKKRKKIRNVSKRAFRLTNTAGTETFHKLYSDKTENRH